MVRLALIPANGWAQPAGPAAPQPAIDQGSVPDFEESVARFKRELISRALEDNDGVMTRAAKALGLKYTTFVAMVHRLDVSTGEDRDSSD
jgi:transcriptional regulator with GAF, ATPase, and Fis domain